MVRRRVRRGAQRQEAVLRLGTLLRDHPPPAAQRVHPRMRAGHPLVRQRGGRHPGIRVERGASAHGGHREGGLCQPAGGRHRLPAAHHPRPGQGFGQPRRAWGRNRPHLVSGGGEHLHPARVVLARKRERPGAPAGEADRHLRKVRGRQRHVPAEHSAHPGRPAPRA